MNHKHVYFKDYCVAYSSSNTSNVMFDCVGYTDSIEEARDAWSYWRKTGHDCMISRYNDETERYEEINDEEY